MTEDKRELWCTKRFDIHEQDMKKKEKAETRKEVENRREKTTIKMIGKIKDRSIKKCKQNNKQKYNMRENRRGIEKPFFDLESQRERECRENGGKNIKKTAGGKNPPN